MQGPLVTALCPARLIRVRGSTLTARVLAPWLLEAEGAEIELSEAQAREREGAKEQGSAWG